MPKAIVWNNPGSTSDACILAWDSKSILLTTENQQENKLLNFEFLIPFKSLSLLVYAYVCVCVCVSMYMYIYMYVSHSCLKDKEWSVLLDMSRGEKRSLLG